MNRYLIRAVVFCLAIIMFSSALSKQKPSEGDSNQNVNNKRVQLPYNDIVLELSESAPEKLSPLVEVHFIILLKREPSMQHKYEAYVDDVVKQHMPPAARLSDKEKIDLFGPSEKEVKRFSGWLQRGGFEIIGITPDNIMIDVGGNAVAFKSLFGSDLMTVRSGGKSKVVMAEAPSVPEEFSGIVDGFVGLSGFHAMPRSKRHRRVR